jgi:hypothetical protein
VILIKLTQLVTAIQGAVDQAMETVSRENINTLMGYFHQSKKSVSLEDSSDFKDIEYLTPKTVRMRYPKMTKDGPVEHFISVPLITLIPVPSLQLDDVKVEMDLEVMEDNGEVMIGFPQSKKGGLFRSASNSSNAAPNAKITITIKADEKSSGVQAIVEGYNKTLRAQIPN